MAVSGDALSVVSKCVNVAVTFKSINELKPDESEPTLKR